MRHIEHFRVKFAAVAVVFQFFTTVLLPSLAIAADVTVEFTEYAPGVFVHLGVHEEMSVKNLGDIANTGFIIGNQSVAVVDPGGSPAMGNAMRAAIRERTDLPISHVILTHIHPDHVLGGIAFSDISHVLAHESYPRAVAQRGQLYIDRYLPLFDDPGAATLLAPTDLVNKSSPVSVDLGDRELIIAAHTTAHTDHDLSVLDEHTQTLWASDLLFAERIPSLDGSLVGWLGVMEELDRITPQLVIPGHGEPGPWNKLSNLQRQYLGAVLEQTRQQIASNTRLSEAVELVAHEEAQRWQLHELRHRGNVTKAYTELEWE
jgi:quinoprotein relay system zinc metallohydrolase 2